jgi:hypothetical protein
MEKRRLAQVEAHVFDLFRQRGTARLLAAEIFARGGPFANADLVRAFEDLEKKWRLLVRYTDEGDDWVQLTPEGVKQAGLTPVEQPKSPQALPHPPKSST